MFCQEAMSLRDEAMIVGLRVARRSRLLEADVQRRDYGFCERERKRKVGVCGVACVTPRIACAKLVLSWFLLRADPWVESCYFEKCCKLVWFLHQVSEVFCGLANRGGWKQWPRLLWPSPKVLMRFTA